MILGKTDDAIKVLTYLRGTKVQAHEEMKEYSMTPTTKLNIKEIIYDKILLKTFGKVLVLSIGFQLAGYNAVSVYLQTILKQTNTSVGPEITSLIVGCVELFACFCTILLTDRFGRKPILGTSLIGMALGMVCSFC